MLVLSLADPGCSSESCGGKASTLALLRSEGFVVPDGFVLTNSGVAALDLQREHIEGILREAVSSLEKRCAGERALGPDGALLLACRSSCTCEDGATASYAGMFETKLNVSSVDSIEAATSVAVESFAALTGAHELYKADTSGGVAVLVQEMVHCEWSGVAFSVDPVDGSDVVVIEAVEGLCDKLTSGEVTPQQFRVGPASQRGGASRADQPAWVQDVAATIARDRRAVWCAAGC
jgi:pyruvate,water dikinase